MHDDTLPVIDLRSDTVTQPTEAMREAMARAAVGDDVFGDDPTVRALEEKAAFLLGKEAALFLPSGTMANLAALLSHTTPGQEVLLGRQCHIYRYEVGGLSRVAGLLPALFRDDDGLPDPDEVRSLLHPPSILFPQPVDSVMISLSKGLSAPVGSVLAGRRDFIERARKARKLLGGGMRQVGVIAAAGIVALETMIARLAEDHAVAAAIADALAAIDGVHVDRARVQTNMVYFTLAEGDAASFVERLARHGVLAVAMGPRLVRFVTHRHIALSDVPRIAAAVRASL